MKLLDITEQSVIKKMLMEHKTLVLKYFYGVNDVFNNRVLTMAQQDIQAFYQKYAGDKCRYVLSLSQILYSIVLYRMSECVNSGKFTVITRMETTASRHITDINETYKKIPDFYGRIWVLFARYINGDKNGQFTDEFLEEMVNDCIIMFSKGELRGMNDFSEQMVCAIISFCDERSKEIGIPSEIRKIS